MDVVEKESSSNPETPADNSEVGNPITEEHTPAEEAAHIEATQEAIEAAKEAPPVEAIPVNDAQKAHELEMSTVAHESWLKEREEGFKSAEEFLQRHAAIALTNGHRTVCNDLRNVHQMLSSVKSRVLSTHYWKHGAAAKQV